MNQKRVFQPEIPAEDTKQTNKQTNNVPLTASSTRRLNTFTKQATKKNNCVYYSPKKNKQQKVFLLILSWLGSQMVQSIFIFMIGLLLGGSKAILFFLIIFRKELLTSRSKTYKDCSIWLGRTTPFSQMTDILSSTPFTPLGILVKSSLPRAFWHTEKVQLSVPVTLRSSLSQFTTRKTWLEKLCCYQN